MPNILSSITGFFGGSGDKKDSQPAPIAKNEDETASPKLPDRTQSEEIKYEGSKKRPIAVDSQESLPRKKVHRRGADERRLTGYYSVPATAQPIHPPLGRNSDDSEKQPKPKNTMTKPGAGAGFRPKNTLNHSPHNSTAPLKPNGAGFMHPANRKRNQKSNVSARTTEAPKPPTNPPRSTASNGDGFEDHELASRVSATGQRPTKRPRLEMKTSVVDMTNDEDDGEEIIALNRRPLPQVRKPSGNDQGHGAAPALFTSQEFNNVDSMLSSQNAKKKRRSKDGRASSQASSREVLADASNGYVETIGLESDEILQRELEENTRQAATDNARLPINLVKDFDKIRPFKSQPSKNGHSEKSVAIHDAPQNLTEPRVQLGRLQASSQDFRHQSMHNKANGETRAAPVESNLRHTFQRETTTSIPQQKVRTKVKSVSRTDWEKASPITDDSDDPLNGEPTVPSQTSRSVSPQKKSTPSNGNAASTRASGKSSSPGDLRPTQFNSRRRVKHLDEQRAGNNIDPSESYQNDNRVRIAAFWATSCVLTSGELMLQYDEAEKQFDLYCDGAVQVLPGKRRTISIGESEARTFIYSTGDHRVHLKGVIGGISNGHVCIAFLDWDAVKWVMDSLMEATERQMKVHSIPKDQMDKAFKLQIDDIQLRYSKQLVQRTREEALEAAKAKQARGQVEEDIQYDIDHVASTSTRRTAGARLRKEGQQLYDISPYFGESQPRRSSRQTRQIKQLSPPPEPVKRWTQMNTIPRWNHSVVYPPEGLRRVTVDFQDLERLDEGEFLNDNIISYALRRIEENISLEHKDDVFFFNSFFYTALTSKNGRKSFNYDAVKRWTKNKDIFTLPYVVVPINIDLHWFVAIICNLPSVSHKPVGLEDVEEEGNGQGGEARNLDSSVAAVDGDATETPIKELADAAAHTDAAPSSQTMGNGVGGEEMQAQTAAMDRLSISQEEADSKAKITNGDDDVAADHSDVEVLAKSGVTSSAPKRMKKKAAPPPKKYDPDLPTIITLDSFGTGHSTETRNLKDYLKAEAEAKRSMDLDTKELQGMTAKGIPEQTNFCDCGLYLVGYVEEFAKNPRQFVTKVLTRQLDKQADFASFNPSAKREEIRNELLKLNEEQDAARKLEKSEKKSIAKGVAQAPASSPTPAPPKNIQQQVKTSQVENRRVEGRNSQSKQSSEPGISAGDPKRIAGATEDEELEVCVPQAMTEPVGVQKIETATPPQRSLELPQELHGQHPNSPFQRHDPATTPTQKASIGTTAVDDSEEMLDTADEPIKGKLVSSAMPRTAADPVKSSDILAGLEQEINKKQAEILHRESMAHGQITADAETHSNVQPHPPREQKKNSNPTEVIHLDESNSQLEVPESPAGAEG